MTAEDTSLVSLEAYKGNVLFLVTRDEKFNMGHRHNKLYCTCVNSVFRMSCDEILFHSSEGNQYK